MLRTVCAFAVFLVPSMGALAVAEPETAGVGMALGSDGKNIVVGSILPDTPAGRSRAFHVGDRLLAVGQGDRPAVNVTGMSISDVVKLIRGPRGTTVQLTVLPRDADMSQARVVPLVRGTLKGLARWGDGDLLAPGTKAPDTRIPGLGGMPSVRVSDLAGKVVVLKFWSVGCAPCQPLIAAMQRYPETYPAWANRVVLLSVSVDEDAEAAAKHLREKGWDKTHNVWADSDALKAFHVNSMPTTYVIDRHGLIATANGAEDVPAVVNRLLRDE